MATTDDGLYRLKNVATQLYLTATSQHTPRVVPEPDSDIWAICKVSGVGEGAAYVMDQYKGPVDAAIGCVPETGMVVLMPGYSRSGATETFTWSIDFDDNAPPDDDILVITSVGGEGPMTHLYCNASNYVGAIDDLPPQDYARWWWLAIPVT